MNEPVAIESTDFWVKVVEKFQQDWALIATDEAEAVHMYFISDKSGVFHEMLFSSANEAREALVRNGFRRFAGHSGLQSFQSGSAGRAVKRRTVVHR